MRAPAFSIVIPACNQAAYVAHAIQSVLSQDFPAGRFELIVVDDGSTDATSEALAPFAKLANVQLLRQPNWGQAAAIEAGVARATMDYVCLLDADDLYHPGKLAAVAAEIERRSPDGGEFFLCHDIEYRDEVRGLAAPHTQLAYAGVSPDTVALGLERLTLLVPFAIPAGQVYSRALLERVLKALPASEWRQGADMALAWGAAYACGRVDYLHRVLATYRLHGANYSGALREDGSPAKHPHLLSRWPRLLRALERLVDSLPLDPGGRAARLAHLAWLENRTATRSARHAEPPLTLAAIVYGEPGSAASERTLQSLRLQRHVQVELRPISAEAAGGPQLRSLAATLLHCNSQYLVLARAGDCYDPVFAERMLSLMRHRSLCGVGFCDYRLLDAADRLIQNACGYAVGLTEHRFHAALQAPQPRELFAPRAANIYRRTPALDGFIEFLGARGGPHELARSASWLLNRIAQSLDGALRVAECHVSLQLDPGERAVDLRDPLAGRAPLFGAPDPAAARELCRDFAAVRRAELERYLGDAFPRWTAMLAQALGGRQAVAGTAKA